MPEASYVVRDDFVFTACHFDQDAHEGEFYTEHDEPTPEEIRLLSSLGLPIAEDRGFMSLYPDYASLKVEGIPQLDDKDVIKGLEQQLRRAIQEVQYRADAGPPLPPSSYRWFHWPISMDVQQRLFASIDVSNHLLIRGLSTWLKSSMLYMHLEFGEESNYPLWVSLDASLSLILDSLKQTGMANPSAIDAQNYIHDAFGEVRSGLKYFQEFYEDRIVTMHPQSRFGTYLFAPLGHDDFYWLHNGLREIYRFLILGEVVDPQAEFDTEDFWEKFKSASKERI